MIYTKSTGYIPLCYICFIYCSNNADGQLTRVDDAYYGNSTTFYSYDSRGNITEKKVYPSDYDENSEALPNETKTFTYANVGWKDLLIAVDGVKLTYDEIGNVLTFGDRSFSWNTGRYLAKITENGHTYSYKYDENGIRTSKTVNGVTTYYNTKDGVIVSQSNGTDTMYFQYDSNGTPFGFIYNDVQYFYMTNQMGDVIAITDSNGDFIAKYVYDAWGEVLGVVEAYNGNAEQLAIANANPIRYRGYYYDTETGYYYLQSRYYDPSICRFINSDIPEIAQMEKDIPVGTNLFAYCSNEPVNSSDHTGNISVKFIGFGIQIAISWGKFIAGIEYIFYKSGNKWKPALFIFIGGSASFNNAKKACNKILSIINPIKKGFTIKKMSKIPSFSISLFAILGNKKATISNYTGWFTNYGITYKHISLSVAISRFKETTIASIGLGVSTQRLGISFAQTMYFRYDSQAKSFKFLSTLQDNIYNKIAWIKMAGALIL